MFRHAVSMTVAVAAAVFICGCGPSEKNAPLPPTDLKKRTAVFGEVKKQLAVLEKADIKSAEQLLLHEDHRVRRAAIKRLSAFNELPDSVIDGLSSAAVKDTGKDVRIEALIALAKIDNERAVEPMISALADSDPKVRLWAYKSIRRLEKKAVPVMIHHITAKSPVATKTYKGRAGKTQTLFDVLLSLLSEMGKSAVPYLVEILKNPQKESAAKAVDVLGEIGSSAGDSVPLLLHLLDSTSDSTLKKNIIVAISKIGDMDPQVMPKLLELSEDSDNKIARAAKQALKKLEEDS